MVRISNILTESGLISMDCYMEGVQDNSFRLVLNAGNYSVEKTTLIYPNTYAMQVIDRIRELGTKGRIPEETITIWG